MGFSSQTTGCIVPSCALSALKAFCRRNNMKWKGKEFYTVMARNNCWHYRIWTLLKGYTCSSPVHVLLFQAKWEQAFPQISHSGKSRKWRKVDLLVLIWRLARCAGREGEELVLWLTNSAECWLLMQELQTHWAPACSALLGKGTVAAGSILS